MPDPPGLDLPRLRAWLEDRLPDAEPPFRFEPLTGGNSNLTFRVTDTVGHTWVLRRPPLGQALATAHDVLREARILTAVRAGGVPAPDVLATCQDPAVSDAPFVVMEHITGTCCHSAADAAQLTPGQRQSAGESMVATLAALHQVDPGDVGLADLGRRDAYLERQLARWRKQWQATRTRVLPSLEETFQALSARVPAQQRTSIVHGDYRLDNCVLGDDGTVRAVLDWEISTLGDPLADLGLHLAYSDPAFAPVLQGSAASTSARLPRAADIAQRYAVASGRDLSDLAFYVALGYFKIAVIAEGIHARYLQGRTRGPGFETVGEATAPLAAAGLRALTTPL